MVNSDDTFSMQNYKEPNYSGKEKEADQLMGLE